MAVTAALVKELRQRTGAGMMECKKALVETDGDLDAAAEHLRKTGIAKADNKSSRVAAEGQIMAAAGDNKAVLVEVNSETDFVAKDDNFMSFAAEVAQAALADVSDVDALMAQPASNADSLEEARKALIAKIKENIQVRRMVSISDSGVLAHYIHGGRIGVLVALEGGTEELARDIAMHVAATNPPYISADHVPAEEVAKEKDILVAQAAESGKPPEIIEKMVGGRLRKHLSEITLLGQPFVKDPDVTVEKLLSQHSAKVTQFHRLEVGEGIEKKEENFADEVRKQLGDDNS
ncbi:MAG: translation elongation factor Ts [Lysobacterales bacterium]